MTITPVNPSLKKIAATPNAGYALINGTGTVLTFTTPNDGQNHRYQLFTEKHVTVAETGGAIQLSYFTPDNSNGVSTFFGGGQGTGVFLPNGPQMFVAGPNTVVTVSQSSALTVGASLLFCEIWGT